MILITGAAGYIASHCVLEFIKNQKEILIFDNLSTGHIETIETLKKISPKIKFIQGDLKNLDEVEAIFKNHKIDGVLHFAAYSQVAESIKNPDKYWQNNVVGSTNLIKTMVKYNVLKIVFSSTAATYGNPKYTPIDENHETKPINPYGETKLEIEKILAQFDKSHGLKSIKLRYFNVIGADDESQVGEWHEPETHLIPNILKSIFNNQDTFKIFGDNYKTPDGTCIRDYIDVKDLARAHKLAFEYLQKENKSDVFNLGTQSGASVKEILNAVEKATNKKIKFEILDRRKGDPAILIADSSKAKNILGWSALISLEDSIKSAYLWEEKMHKKRVTF